MELAAWARLMLAVPYLAIPSSNPFTMLADALSASISTASLAVSLLPIRFLPLGFLPSGLWWPWGGLSR